MNRGWIVDLNVTELKFTLLETERKTISKPSF